MTSTETVSSTWPMRCPKCGKDDEIDICADVWVRVCPEGTDVSAAKIRSARCRFLLRCAAG
jgi:hypothetical protein